MLLTAAALVENYWITVQPQYREGSPNGYAVLHYDGAPESLPLEPTPQPGTMQPWSLQQIGQVNKLRCSSACMPAHALRPGVYMLAFTWN